MCVNWSCGLFCGGFSTSVVSRAALAVAGFRTDGPDGLLGLGDGLVVRDPLRLVLGMGHSGVLLGAVLSHPNVLTQRTRHCLLFNVGDVRRNVLGRRIPVTRLVFRLQQRHLLGLGLSRTFCYDACYLLDDGLGDVLRDVVGLRLVEGGVDGLVRMVRRLGDRGLRWRERRT